MIHQEHWVEFELFSPFSSLLHGVFSRKIGKDHSSLVKQVFCLSDIVSMKQVHGNRIIRVEETTSFPLPPCDGVMTNSRQLALMALHADCQVAIFYDPVKMAIAVVHAGWRGQVKQIYAACIQGMIREFGSSPSDIRVAISPSLGPTYAEFINHQTELPGSWHPFRLGECHFDLWEVAKWQLLEQGILSENLQIARICTYSNQEEYFSYRRDKGILGHNATVACLL